jgi:endonuclease/exonuclease/phosphatase family metal-dependent hydrolase
MKLRILTLNCQKGYRRELYPFLKRVFAAATYDFVLLQEAPEKLPELLDSAASYRISRSDREPAGQWSHLAIMYRRSYRLISHTLIAFKAERPRFLRHPEFGLLLGTFADERGFAVRLGSLHLHPSFNRATRRVELVRLKDALRTKEAGVPTIVGGDCNFGPWELGFALRLMAPEFVCPTENAGATMDSRYTEPAPSILNAGARFLAAFGIGMRLPTDHFFIDRTAAAAHRVSCGALPERVSDHSPVEMDVRVLP